MILPVPAGPITNCTKRPIFDLGVSMERWIVIVKDNKKGRRRKKKIIDGGGK
jgi:hypothetical protein